MALMPLTNHDYFNLVVMYGELGRNLAATIRTFNQRFPNKVRVTRKKCRVLFSNLQNVGSFQKKRIHVHRVVNNEDNEINVLAFFRAFPEGSIREASFALRLSYSSIWKILRKHNFWPFKFQLTQTLHEGDDLRRLVFCEWLLVRSQEDEHICKKILWSDECKFSKNGLFNRRNTHHWDDVNHHLHQNTRDQTFWSFNVWCGLKDDRVVGPFFYDHNLNGDHYLFFIENEITNYVEDLPLAEYAQMFYQQDGAPPHNRRDVTFALYQLFGDQWIGNGGPIRWPARSPDLTPLDFFLWGYLKDKVYGQGRPLTSKEDCQDKIRASLNELSPESIRKATSGELLRRVHLCLRQNGGIFENFL